jgi:hypothetical protein
MSAFVSTESAVLMPQPGVTPDGKATRLSSGDQVQVETRSDGTLITQVRPVRVKGNLLDETFYQVSVRGQKGWMSAHQLTEPSPREFERANYLNLMPKNIDCPTDKHESSGKLKGLALQIPELQNAIDKNMPLASPKSEREIDRYMCLYHDDRIESEKFLETYKKFQKSAKQASQGFGVPYGMIMCTMLVESGLFYNPREKKEYKGLPQFGSALVEDLNRVKTRKPFDDMWSQMKKINPQIEISDQAVRSSPDPAGPAAAIALAYQWIYWERLKKVNCKDCSISNQLNRKDLYMMVAGYNWGPYSLDKVAHKTASEMRNSPPPPKESRDYMARMENCLEAGYDKSFRDEAMDRVGTKKDHLLKGSVEYRAYNQRVARCDQHFPIN